MLLVGFDSAWTAGNAGGIVGAIRQTDGSVRSLGLPMAADFDDAANVIRSWQQREAPGRTLVLLDQPTVVANASGQRPVESIVRSPVGRRRGGVQPANTGRAEMFGVAAPVWRFLEAFGGSMDPRELVL